MSERKILLVDDDENILNSFKRSLRKADFNVLTATGARQGLKCLSEEIVQVVVSDQNMPEMMGIEFLKQVKRKYPKIIRLLFTGFADKDVSVRAIQEAKVFKILKKPCNGDELLKAVEIGLQLHKFSEENPDRRNHEFDNIAFRLVDKYKQKLVDERLIEEYQLREAVQTQKKTGESLGLVLIKCDFLTEEMLLAFLGKQRSFEVIKLEEYEIDHELVRRIPKRIARFNKFIPLCQREGIVTVALSDPYNYFALQDIWALLGSKTEIKVCQEAEILAAIDRFYSDRPSSQKGESGELFPECIPEEKCPADPNNREEAVRLERGLDLETKIESQPIVNALNRIILEGIQKGSSDIHISAEQTGARVRYRVDGIMVDGFRLPKENFLPVVSRIKVLASLDISKRNFPQDGRLKIKMEKKEVDARISTYPAKLGESVVLRLLDGSPSLLNIENLGFSDPDKIKVETLLRKNQGLILSTGPTGSGKTTTLYSIIQALNTEERKIITIDDPIEYQMDNIIQGEVNILQGMTFSRALKSVLRQDPDIILVGEIRDAETAEIALQAAMTGHLVLSTLHTGSAASTVTRLLDLGIPRFVISSSLIGIIAQRLVRKICLHCKEGRPADPALLKMLGLRETGGAGQELGGKGCIKCNDTGYKGRLGLFETMAFNEEIKSRFSTQCAESDLEAAAIKSGMTLLKQDGINKARLGLTTLKEISRVC